MTATGRLYTTPREFSAACSGNDWSLAVTLWDGAAVKAVNGWTFKACLRDHSGAQAFSQVAQSSGTTGADWTNGVVVVTFTAAVTADLSLGEYLLEIEGTDSGGKVTTWPYLPVEVQYVATRS